MPRLDSMFVQSPLRLGISLGISLVSDPVSEMPRLLSRRVCTSMVALNCMCTSVNKKIKNICTSMVVGKSVRKRKTITKLEWLLPWGPFSEGPGVGWVQNDNKNDNETITNLHFFGACMTCHCHQRLAPLHVAAMPVSDCNLVGRRIKGEQGKRLIACSRPIGEQAFRTDGRTMITGMHQHTSGETQPL